MGIMKYLPQLMQSALFAGCDPKRVETFFSEHAVKAEAYPAGSYLMRRSSVRHGIGILLRGCATVERISPNGEMHMSRLKQNDLFGAASLFCSDAAYVVDIRCVEPCRILFLQEDELMDLFQSDPCVLRNYLCYLNGRIRFLNQRLDALSKNTVPDKLMSAFVSEATDGTVEVRSYTELAKSLCLSRATLYRALDTLCAEGKILRDGKNIIILEEP